MAVCQTTIPHCSFATQHCIPKSTQSTSMPSFDLHCTYACHKPSATHAELTVVCSTFDPLRVLSWMHACNGHITFSIPYPGPDIPFQQVTGLGMSQPRTQLHFNRRCCLLQADAQWTQQCSPPERCVLCCPCCTACFPHPCSVLRV